MNGATVIDKPKIEIQPELLRKFQSQIHEAGQVVVHCFYKAGPFYGDKIRIWKTTFLLYGFTLIFSGLPKTCMMFDLIEQIQAPGAFEVKNITRNKSDVYFLKI